MVAALASAAAAIPRAAGQAPLIFRVDVRKPDGARVAWYRGTLKNGVLNVRPTLCTGRYRYSVDSTDGKGHETPPLHVSLDVTRGRVGGRPRRCPFDGLPRRGLTKMVIEAKIPSKHLLTLVATPRSGRGDPYAPLQVRRPKLGLQQLPIGRIALEIRLTYTSGRSYTVGFDSSFESESRSARR